MILRTKFHVVSSLLSVFKDFDASVCGPLHSIENELARKRNYGKS